MTPRSLFNIILKVLGILFIKDILAILPQFLSVILLFSNPEMVKEAFWTVLASLVMLFLYCSLAYYLIFRSDWIIDQLKLEDGFKQESFQLNMHRSTILSIVIIVTGGLLVTTEIPNLVWDVNEYLREKRLSQGLAKPSVAYMLLDGVRILIGLLLMGNHRHIVNFIERKRRKVVSSGESDS